MRFLAVILALFSLNTLAEEPDNCLHALGNDHEICQHKRALYYFGSQTNLVEEQLDKIDEDIRLAFKNNNFQKLNKYIRKPFKLILIDYRKARTGKDAREVLFNVKNTDDLKRSLKKIEAEDPANYFWTTSQIAESPFIRAIIRQNRVRLTDPNSSVYLTIDPEFKTYITTITFIIS
jgi:hypothetical protein